MCIRDSYKGVLFEKNKTEKNLNELNGKISDLEEKIKLRGEQLKAQARETQVSKEEASLLYVLASSDSISDAVSKTIGVTTLVSANNEVMQKQISDKKKLKEMREDVTKSLNEIESKAKVL
ncbi:peptidase M23, partial [Enterococcus sp. S181_ASV_20]|nr:peptidase M23 [Enterococcus sp. S181_ASV_20]